MASANITVGVTGSDKVSGMLQNITGKVKALGQAGGKAGGGGGGLLSTLQSVSGVNIAAFAGTAAAVAGAAMAVKGYVSQLRALSDEYANLSGRALDAGTSASELQKLVGAMKQLNIRGASLESVSNALAMMKKNTGLVGSEGFASALKGVAALSSAQERAAKLSEIFGKQMGLALAQIVDGGEESVNALFAVADSVDAVSNESVQKFADISTAFEQAGESIHTSWANCMMGITESLEAAFGASMEEVVRFVADFVHYFHAGFEAVVKVLVAIVNTVFRLGKVVGEFLRNLFVGLWDGIKGLFTGEGFVDPFMDSMHQLAEEASNEFRSIRESWEAVGDLRTLKPRGKPDRSLVETASKAVASLGVKAGEKAGAAMGRAVRQSVDFSDAFEEGSNKARVLLAKIRMGVGSSIPGRTASAQAVEKSRPEVRRMDEAQSPLVRYVKGILDELRNANRNLQEMAVC